MPESYFRLSARDKADALNAASAVSGRPPHLLEKDIWVIWSLAALFESQFGSHLVFKGGTALSKAYNVIRRFSEDVDLTCDVPRCHSMCDVADRLRCQGASRRGRKTHARTGRNIGAARRGARGVLVDGG
jgi:predicted nucleotidyltransferase component of viral defense system